MQSIKLMGKLFWFEAQRFRAFPSEAIASIGSRLIEVMLFIVFWLVVAQYAGGGGINQKEVVTYYLIINGLTPFFYLGFGFGSEFIKMIRRGELNQLLIKPINPLLYPYAVRSGRNAVNLCFGLVQVVAGIVYLGGIKQAALIYLLPVFISMFFINFAFNLLLGTCSFYLTEAGGIKNAFTHVARFARGEAIPLFLMPAGLAQALQYTPFPASQYHLGIVLQGTRLPEWKFVLIGLAWSALLMFVALRFWRRGIRRYEAVGI